MTMRCAATILAGTILALTTGCWGPILIMNEPLSRPVALRTINSQGELALADGYAGL